MVCARLETIRTLVPFLVCFGRWLPFCDCCSLLADDINKRSDMDHRKLMTKRKRTTKRQYVTVVIQYAVSILKTTKYTHIFEEFTKLK